MDYKLIAQNLRGASVREDWLAQIEAADDLLMAAEKLLQLWDDSYTVAELRAATAKAKGAA